MATLTGNSIASTYTGLLSVSGAVGADTVEAVTDGAGTSTSLSLSQQRATITLGSGAGDDFIVDGTTLVVEGDNNRVGIGTASPDANTKLDVAGVIRASGGIQPNGNAYSANEVLDDYEEGTFTPAFSSASGSITHSIQLGHYTKIGNTVFVQGKMASGIGTASGAITLTGLPYTVDVRTPIELWADSWVNAPLWGDANPGATTAVLVKSRLASGNGTNIIATDFSATNSWNVLTFQFSYKHA